MSRQKLSPDVTGLVIAFMTFALILSGISIFWQAQVIAKQDAVIRMLEDRSH